MIDIHCSCDISVSHSDQDAERKSGQEWKRLEQAITL
jgi:hypothetical protein